MWCVKVWILVGFYDIRCDIGVFGCEWLESGDFVGVYGGFIGCLKIKFVCR